MSKESTNENQLDPKVLDTIQMLVDVIKTNKEIFTMFGIPSAAEVNQAALSLVKEKHNIEPRSNG